MVRAEAGLDRQIRDRERFGEIRLDELGDAAQRGRRQATTGRNRPKHEQHLPIDADKLGIRSSHRVTPSTFRSTTIHTLTQPGNQPVAIRIKLAQPVPNP